MIKRFLITVLILSAAALSVFFIIKVFFPEKPLNLDQSNKIFIVKGDVKIKKAKEMTGWQKVEPSAVIERGDIVETAEGSAVEIIIGKNTDKSVRVEEKSRVQFREINPAYLDLPSGKILIALKKLEGKSSFTVKTPTAICGARGTAWSEEATDYRTKVCVYESQIYAQAADTNNLLEGMRKYTVTEGTQRVIEKGKPVSPPQKIGEDDLRDWNYWDKNVTFLREGKILVNDFNVKENFNNLKGAFGSWVVFYSDINQHCRDEFTALGSLGGTGYSLKLDYDVDSPFSAYNGFFTNLMGIDISDYKYLIFYIKGDKAAGFTTKVSVELKNKLETGKVMVDGITDEWKKIVIPLDNFAGIDNFKEMKELVILFTDLTATKKEGVIYIDDIYFAKAE